MPVMRLCTTIKTLAIALLMLVYTSPRAVSGPILNIDATNTAHVVITATTEVASASSSGASYHIQLDNFFTSGQPNFGDYSTGNLVAFLNSGSNPPNGASDGYNFIFPQGTSLTFSVFGSPPQNFVSGTQAFAGQETVNLSFATFRTQNFTGNVRVVDNFGRDTGVIIGQYQLTVAEASVVPAPASIVLMAGMSVLGFGCSRLRRKK